MINLVSISCYVTVARSGSGSHIPNLRFLPGKRLYGVSPCAHRHKVPWWIVVLLIHCIGCCYLLVSHLGVLSFHQVQFPLVSICGRWESFPRSGRWELCCHSVEVGGGRPLHMWEVGAVPPLFQGGRWELLCCHSVEMGGGRSLQRWEVGAVLPLRQGWRWESSL